MENLNTNFGEEPKIDGFIITESSKAYLAETAKWANFLAILGFIFIAIIVILAFGMGAVMAKLSSTIPTGGGLLGLVPSGFVTVLYLLMAALYFFPSLYLFKFAKHAKSAIARNDSGEMQTAFSNHKSVYKFMGIFMIVMLSFYATGIVIAIITGLF